ncbi:MAG: group III truncated hemoglobin [Sphingobacterium sp.]
MSEKSKTDINSITDIKLLVDEFYTKIQNDELLGPIFNKVIQNHWSQHLEKMYKFWQTILLGEHTYYGSPFPPHAKLLIEKKHFDQWLGLFKETVDKHFIGELANKAKWQGERMAEMFQFKISYFQQNP